MSETSEQKTLHCQECGAPNAEKYDGGSAGTKYLCDGCADRLGIEPTTVPLPVVKQP